MKSRLCIVLLAAFLGGCADGLTPQISISRDTLQEYAQKSFPLSNEQGDDDALVIVALSDPEVLLEDGRNQVGLKVHVTARPAGKHPAAKLRPKGKLPRFPKESGGDDSGDSTEAFSGSISVYGDLSYRADERAFYYQNPTFEDATIQLPEALQTPASKITERLLGKYLRENPVYKLEGDGTATKAAGELLRGVMVKDGHLYIQLGM